MTDSRWRLVALVFAGGALGTAARAGIGLALPTTGLPWATVLVNVAGAFCLGALLEWLARTPARPRPGLRLFGGTGVLGGFTTYSALAADTVQRWPWPGLGYALGTVAAGLVAARLGVGAAELLHGRLDRPHALPRDAA